MFLFVLSLLLALSAGPDAAPAFAEAFAAVGILAAAEVPDLQGAGDRIAWSRARRDKQCAASNASFVSQAPLQRISQMALKPELRAASFPSTSHLRM